MKRLYALLLALALACPLLAACAALRKPAPPPALYALRPPPPCPRARAGSPMIAVQAPQLPPGFATSRIALYLSSGRRLDYFAGAAWPSELGGVLQDFIIAAGRHACLSAVAPGESAAAPWRLNVRVNEFAPVYAAGPEAAPALRASLSFTLVSPEREEAVLDFTLRDERPAEENSLTSVVSGLEALLGDILGRAYAKTAAAAK